MISLKAGIKNYPRFSRGNYKYNGWYIIMIVVVLSFLILVVASSIFLL